MPIWNQVIHELSHLVFGRNITLRYDKGIIRVFYAHLLFNLTPPILCPKFYDSPNYDPKPGQWIILKCDASGV